MFNKILLVSTILVVGVWTILSTSNLQGSSNASDKETSLISEKLPYKLLKSDFSVKKLNTVSIIEHNKKVKDYIVDCSSEQTVDDEKYDDYYKSAQFFLKSLSNSNLKNKQLEYTLFAEPPEGKTRLDLFIKFNERFPNNSILLKEIIRVCANSNDKTQCNSNLIETAIALDRNNGAMWLQLIFFNASKENDEGIVYSIQELVKSSFFDDGFVKRIKLYSKSLEGSPANNVNLNMTIAFGEEAIKLPAYSTIIQWCKRNINDTAKADACLQLGNYMEKSSKILIDQMIGIALKKIIFEAQGNTKLFEKADSEYKKIMEFITSEQSKKASSLLIEDERLLRSWLNNIENYGEALASKLLVEEAINLSKNENYFPCKS